MTIPACCRHGIPSERIGTESTNLVSRTPGYEVGTGDPGSVLPAGSLFSEVAPGIFIIGAPAPWFGGTYRR